jgi:hypothetical protein
MTMNKFDEVNEDEERENARQQRVARLRAMWRAHPILFPIGAVVLIYAIAMGNLFLKPGHPHGSSAFLWSGILTVIAFVFLTLRLWTHRRARRAGSD